MRARAAQCAHERFHCRTAAATGLRDRPAHVFLHYEWEEEITHDTRLGARVLLLGGLALLFCPIGIVACSKDRVQQRRRGRN